MAARKVKSIYDLTEDELRKKYKELARTNSKRELSTEEENFFYDLCSRLHRIQKESVPSPTCCQAAKDYPAIRFHVDYWDGDSNKAPGKWTVYYKYSDVSIDLVANTPPAKFCPFCGAPLPEMVRTNNKKNVCRIQDGGYYCSTCKERLQNCVCLDPAAAFEPRK